MSKYIFSRYKIKLDATSKKVQGLRVGDVVRRQYFDYPNLIYSLMVVLEIGFDNVVVNGVAKQSHYFIGALMDGDEPESGQLLDFVRVTNLFDNDRGGALYLTASDDQAPYLDVVDGMATENTLCYPFMIGGVGDIANINKYACVGESYVTQEYFKSSEDSYRVFKLTKNNTPLGSSNNILIKQSISQALKNPQRVLISFKHRGSKEAQGIPMSFGYTSGEQMDGIDSFYCATTWKYHFSAITIDYPEQYQRSFEVDLTNYLTSENDWFEMSDLNIVLLSDIGNFGKSTKTRIGKLNGILDPVFGNIDGYGAFFQKMYATKNVNIAGTLTAGDEKGFASTFYVGKIHTNCLINSLYGNFSGIVNIVGNEQSPSGIGKVFELTSGSATIIAQSEEWTNNNKDKKYCFSFWAKANNVGTFNVKTNINENTDFTIDIPNSWRRYCVPFTIKNISGHGCDITILSQDPTFMFSSAQLESGDRNTLYQPTDSVLSDVDGYGAWFNRGGIGGTIQNPLLKLDQDGSIRSNNGSFVINNDGTGYFSNGAIKWFGDRVELAENVKLKWINLDPETQVNLKGEHGVDANLLDWVSEWDNGKTMLNDSLIVTPKIFSGNVLNGLLNGVAIGNFPVTYINKSGVGETYSVNGIAGFKSGKRIFKIDDSGGEIGGWVLDNDSIYLGSKINTPQSFSSIIGDITIGTLGIRGKAWYFDASGAVQIGLGSNSIKYDPTVGNIVFGDSVTMKWGQINVSGGEINGTYIANDSISTDHIKTNAIDSSKILAGSIVAGKIATDAIEAINIKSGVITGDKIASGTIEADQIKSGTITGDLIKSDTITGSHIQANTINGDRIIANTITSLGKVTAAEFELKSLDGMVTNFHVSSDGKLTSRGATINGTLISTDGSIGGWLMSDMGISAGNISILSSGEISNKIGSEYYWWLKNDGSIMAKKISVLGGDIAGWNIDGDSIYLGQKSNLHRSFSSSGMTIGTNGIRGSKWILDSDGYFLVGGDPQKGERSYVMFDPNSGNLVFGDGVSIKKSNGTTINITDNIDSLSTQFTVLGDKISAEVSSVRDDLAKGTSLLNNPNFNLMNYWQTDNEVKLLTSSGKWIFANNKLFGLKKAFAGVTYDGSRTALFIRNKYILQLNDNLIAKPTFKQNTENLYVPEYFYIKFYYRVKKAGTLAILFDGEDKTGWIPYNSISVVTALSESDTYQTFETSGQWNGTGNFKLSFTGEIYLYGGVVLAKDKVTPLEEKSAGWLTEADGVKIWAASEITMPDGTKVKASSLFNVTADGIFLKSDNIKLEGVVTANENFRIREDGSIETNNAKLSGYLYSKFIDVVSSDAILQPDNSYLLNTNLNLDVSHNNIKLPVSEEYMGARVLLMDSSFITTRVYRPPTKIETEDGSYIISGLFDGSNFMYKGIIIEAGTVELTLKRLLTGYTESGDKIYGYRWVLINCSAKTLTPYD